MTDDIDPQEDRALDAEYALGLLSPAEEKAFEELLAMDPALRAEYARCVEGFVGLTDNIGVVVPPAALLDRINTTLFGPIEKKKSLFARFGFVGGAFAGLAVAIVLLFAFNQTNFLRNDLPNLVAEVASEDASFVVLASFDPNAQTLLMNQTSGGPRLERVREIWLIANDNPPVSLGIWANNTASITLNVTDELANQMNGSLLAISDEPKGGSQTGAPTGDVLAVGQVALAI